MMNRNTVMRYNLLIFALVPNVHKTKYKQFNQYKNELITF